MTNTIGFQYPIDLDAAQIAATLPHRGEILVTERVLIHSHNHYTGWVRWADDLPILEGHFPGMRLVPGVLMIEATAQVAGVGLLKGDPLARDMGRRGYVGLLGGVRKCSFKRPVLPGEQVTIETHTRQMAATAAAVQARLTVDGAEAASIEILMVNTPKDVLLQELGAIQPLRT